LEEDMFSKLEDVLKKYEEIGIEVNDPGVIGNQDKWRKLMKEYSDMTPLVEKYKEYKNTEKEIADAEEMLKDKLDEDMRELVKEELADNKTLIEDLVEQLKVLMLPKDPNDSKNVIVEIRAGAGGDEAAIFAGDLFRMYTKYAEERKFKVDLMELNESDMGGYKEVIFMVKGDGAYSRLKFESGVHRVQRVPATESSGRIHTSTITVAVMPEAEEVDIHVDPNEVRVDVFRSSGNGGQSVNTTDSAVRLTHEPTGLVVSCQDGKSQLKNKEQAFKVLRARLYEMEMRKQQDELASERKSQVGTGDRSEKIRTYNYPQGRVTDHRISLTIHRLEAIVNGDLDPFIDALITHDQVEKMKKN